MDNVYLVVKVYRNEYYDTEILHICEDKKLAEQICMSHYPTEYEWCVVKETPITRAFEDG